jgi:hypothetical protein
MTAPGAALVMPRTTCDRPPRRPSRVAEERNSGKRKAFGNATAFSLGKRGGGDDGTMQEISGTSVSRYLAASARTLYEACHDSGRDDGGRRCSTCCVRDLCEMHRRKTKAPHSSPE